MTIKLEWIKELELCLNASLNSVLVRYLRRFNLPVFGGQRFLVDRIIHALLVSEKLKGREQKCLYKAYPLPVGEDLRTLLKQVGSILQRKEVPPDLEELMRYLDALAENGRQHIFFYALKPERADDLTKLRDPAFIRQSLKKLRLQARFNRTLFKWSSARPFLSAVRHSYDKDQGGQLIFRWIETRYWNQFMKGKSGLPKYRRSRERSVNTFRIDLKDGSGELRLQRLNSRPIIRLEQEHALYQGELAKFIEFDSFEQRPLEPIMKRILRSPDHLEISHWLIRLREGGQLKGQKDPNLFSKLILLFLPGYSVLELGGNWKHPRRDWGPELAHLDFDGSTNSLLITQVCDPMQMSVLIDLVKGGRGPHRERAIQIPEIRYVARYRRDLRPVLTAIDQSLLESQERKIYDAQLKALELGHEHIAQAFEELTKFSKRFISSQDSKGRALAYLTRPASGGLIGLMERALGDRLSPKQRRGIVGLALISVFLFYGWLNARLFVPFIVKSGKAWSVFSFGCLINILMLYAASIMIFGRESMVLAAKWALKFLANKIKDAVLFAIKVIRALRPARRRRRGGRSGGRP